ncbi:multifunctional CCA addition/repair protein [Candidatus Pseudomonas adelgestsugas]|uniref:Multifunctional CCA protein n=1 Tax=Candidatus Pseudomonas adelgestsugas TaxID=1302376 RepID=A0ABX5R761_9PSED|nr:multifunctional CCA addition/repair protein [Candidatus Pseudomonas adelgestsugas]QAX81485.1 Multifunctional CCA protein [Candidatus Pseudomonas adelgestsugas]
MKIYKVGGSVRDRLLGIKSTDIDRVVVGATTKEMLANGYKPVGTDFPVFLDPKNGDEYALARTEYKSGRGYGGFIFHTSPKVTLEEDLIRRDLTINAMAEDDDGNLIDPYNGQRDLEARTLRHVSLAFAEDPLRVLRVARFAARYKRLGFIIAPQTLELMRQISESKELTTLTPERSWKEISRALMENQPQVFIQVLRDCNALKSLTPELNTLFGITQPTANQSEIDIGTHTLNVLEQTALHQQPLTIRWACLLYNLNKDLIPMDKLPQHLTCKHINFKLIKAINNRFKVPKDCQELSLLVNQYHTYGRRALELKPSTLLELLQSFDIYRRPQRFEAFIVSCEMNARGCTDFKQRSYPQAEYLRGAAQAAREVPISHLLNQALQGKELGEALKHERLKALHAYKEQQAL